ncbi:MAG: PhnD/SsuA/transferrin family substrate-binding protein [Arenicellales bacterium]
MLAIANLLSLDLNPLAREIRRALQSSVNSEVRVMSEPTLDDFRSGRAGIALICGLAYAMLRDEAPDRFMPVAAPLVEDDRVADMPVYFSEVVVPSSSRALELSGLSGSRFAYNESVSFSGFRALEHELAVRGLCWNFFAERIRTGSHRESLKRLVAGEADAAAIDSHVLLLEKGRDPSLSGKIRVVEALGPYPAPPIAVNRDACDVPVPELYRLLERLPPKVLQATAVRGWVRVDDAYYSAIRSVVGDITVGNE